MQTQTNFFLPTQPGQRVQTIDILRGFAIFGILTVNMEMFFKSFYAFIMTPTEPLSAIDQAARAAIMFFSEGKFYSTFAFLFGMGMAIQYSRTQERGARFAPFYLRRMLVLLSFGLLHAYFFWVGDILILYSVCGILMLLLFRNRRPKTLLVWTVIFLILPLLINGALFGLTGLSKMTPEGEQMMTEIFAEQQKTYQEADAQASQVYLNGSFLEVTRQRAAEMNMVYSTWPFMGFNVLAMLLLGLYAGKRGLFEVTDENKAFLRKVWLGGLIVGVAGNLLYTYFGMNSARSEPSVPLLISLAGQTFGAPALSLFYMTSLAFLARQPAWQKRLAPLANIGRLAISNYLMQSLVCTTLSYGYGFGLFGTVGPALSLLLAVVIYGIQLPLSAWWLRHFRFGPVEWLWRSLTYMKRQPMRLPAEA